MRQTIQQFAKKEEKAAQELMSHKLAAGGSNQHTVTHVHQSYQNTLAKIHLGAHRDFHPTLIALEQENAEKSHDVLYFRKGNGTRTSKTMFPSV